jgi:hypothetical protein
MLRQVLVLAVLYHLLCSMDTDDDLDDCYLDEESLVILPEDEWDNVAQQEKTRQLCFFFTSRDRSV